MSRRAIVVAIFLFAGLGAVFSAQSGQSQQSPPPEKVDFGRDVLPILKQNCFGCHGPTQQMNGLRLDRRRDAMRGGTLAMIGPGNSQGSRLYLRLVGNTFGQQMPPTGPLASEQIATVRAWIDQGAEWPDVLSGETPPPPPDPRATRLMNALRIGDLGAFRTMAAADKAAGSLKGSGGSTPLMYAVLYGDIASVKWLLDAGADPNAKNEAGATALMWAANDVEKAKLLLDRGATVNARSDDGRTPLLVAAGVPGSASVVQLLLEHGANPSSKAPGLFFDTTPLTEAAYSGDESVFRMLLDHGAEVKAGGPGPLGFALRAQCMSCVEALLGKMEPGPITMTMVLAAPPLGPALATNLLLDHGADLNAGDPAGHTMLMLAAASDALPVDVVKSLIARGADVNARSPRGETALGLAKQRGNTPVVDALIKAGAVEVSAADATSSALSGRPEPAASIRAAVERSLPLLQRNDATFLKKSGCVSCHNNTLTAIAVSTARKQGLAIDDAIARGQVKTIGAYIDTWKERALQGVGIPGDADTVSYILLGLAAENYPADAATDAMAYLLRREQAPDGHWRILAHRPPLESNDIEVTAASMRAMRVYAPAPQRAEYERSARRAGIWLASQSPATNEERAFQLLGLRWSDASRAAIQKAGRALLAEQRRDGGWAQTPLLSSDAYATGQALVALAESGAVPVTDAAFQRGVRFLMNTQFADGSWFVKTRALPIQPHFESGFPYGRDQFISAAATNWATTALALAYVRPS